jgi:hypothetical protein
MQRPLAASPWPTGMDHATIPVENAVPIDHLHLGDSIGHPQVFFSSLSHRQTQEIDQAFFVIFIKGNRGFAMTAVTASFTFEYVFQITAPLLAETLEPAWS